MHPYAFYSMGISDRRTSIALTWNAMKTVDSGDRNKTAVEKKIMEVNIKLAEQPKDAKTSTTKDTLTKQLQTHQQKKDKKSKRIDETSR